MHPIDRILATALVATIALPFVPAAQARQGAFIARGQNGVVSGAAGPRGAAARGARTVTNADGSVTRRSGAAYRGANGSSGYRQSSTTANPDGSVSRSGTASANGARGSASSAGGFTRNADGSWSGSRSTTATSAATGTSYSGSTSIDPATGKPVHSGGCTDAAGNAVSCR